MPEALQYGLAAHCCSPTVPDGSARLGLPWLRRPTAQEWDTLHHGDDIELSSNCLTATKTSSNHPSTVHGTILYRGARAHASLARPHAKRTFHLRLPVAAHPPA